jgi:hypothetical protein
LPTRLYNLCKIGSTEPEYMGVTREEKKSEKKHTRMRRKVATQQNLRDG